LGDAARLYLLLYAAQVGLTSMLSRSAAWLLTALLCQAAWLLTALLCQSALAQPRETAAARDWTYFRNDRFGFSLRYPADVFEPERASDAGDGQVFVSRDGEARLLVGALPNVERLSPGAYQDHIARQSYADYAVTYRRVSGNWFALSGEGSGRTFYEKVIFSCNGRLINSFAMIYPSDRASLFDRIVEGIEKSFRPGTASCPEIGSSAPFPPRVARRVARDGFSALADRIAQTRGSNVIVVLRRRGPPYDYRVVRGYAGR
jgi:hypothetical protein